MKVELINNEFVLTTAKGMSRNDKIRLMSRARNFLKLTIDNMVKEKEREEIAKSGQIDLIDAIKQEDKQQ